MRYGRIGWGMLVLLGASSFAAGQVQEESDRDLKTRAKIAEQIPIPEPAIDRLLNVIDLVLDKHIAPPTRQEMLLSASRNLLQEAKIEATAELSRRASSVSTRTECAEFVGSIWQQAVAAGQSTGAVQRALDLGLLRVVPGEMALLPAKELKVQQQLQANQYVGIGIALSQVEGAFTMNLVPNGPADKAGAKTGDQIESVDGKPTRGLQITGVIDLLRGQEGTEVMLVLKRGDQTLPLKITRGVVPRETVHGRSRADERSPGDYQADSSLPIAYVRIAEIGGSTVHELRQIEQKLRAAGMTALILDLQNVNSSDTHYAAMLADGLLAGGMIGRIREGPQVKEVAADRDCLFQDWPLAVLVSEYTAGTAEWVAAALQDNRRATVVGSPTSGEAYVRAPFPIPGTDENLIVPTGTLERPSGKSLARPIGLFPPFDARRMVISERQRAGESVALPWGVQPDIVVAELQVNGKIIRYAPGADGKGPIAQSSVALKRDAMAQAVELLRQKLGIAAQPKIDESSRN
jgi:C-terminal peptidase prc